MAYNKRESAKKTLSKAFTGQMQLAPIHRSFISVLHYSLLIFYVIFHILSILLLINISLPFYLLHTKLQRLQRAHSLPSLIPSPSQSVVTL